MKKLCALSGIIMCGFVSNAFSGTERISSPSVIISGKMSCSKVLNTSKPFILVLNQGDDLLKEITNCARDAKLASASISALGQLHNPILAYFTSDPKAKPMLTPFDGYYELASLNGNISNNDKQYYTHAHAVLADEKFQGIAGHVDSAKVGMTVEVTIIPLSKPIKRLVDPETGFGSIIG